MLCRIINSHAQDGAICFLPVSPFQNMISCEVPLDISSSTYVSFECSTSKLRRERAKTLAMGRSDPRGAKNHFSTHDKCCSPASNPKTITDVARHSYIEVPCGHVGIVTFIYLIYRWICKNQWKTKCKKWRDMCTSSIAVVENIDHSCGTRTPESVLMENQKYRPKKEKNLPNALSHV